MGRPSKSSSQENDGACQAYHKLLAAVALVICAGGALIGAGEGGNPCVHKKSGGVSYPNYCATSEIDYCCRTGCTDCVEISMPVLTLAGIALMIVAIFMLLMIPIVCFLQKKKTLSIEDLDKNPQQIDKFRRASLEARRASLNSEKMNIAKTEQSPIGAPGVGGAGSTAPPQRRGSKIAIQNQEVVMNPVADGV